MIGERLDGQWAGNAGASCSGAGQKNTGRHIDAICFVLEVDIQTPQTARARTSKFFLAECLMHAEGGGCKKIGVPTPQGVTDILSANPRPAYYTPCARLRATIFPNCSGLARTNESF